MGFFDGMRKGKPPAHLLEMKDADFAAFLAGYGRERYREGQGPFGQSLGPRFYEIHQSASAEPRGFLRDLCRCVPLASDDWAWVGALRLINELGHSDFESQTEYDTVMDHALTFLRKRNIPTMYLNGYEQSWWSRHYPNTTWLTPMPGRPSPNSYVTELAADEEREIAVLAPLGNAIRVSRSPDGRFVAFMYRAQSSDDRTLKRDDEPAAEAATLRELYAEIAAKLGSPSQWTAPELEPFFAYGRPDFR